MTPEKPHELARPESREIVNLFPLARELFALALQNLGPNSTRLQYADPEYASDTYNPPELPNRLNSLVANHPGKYFIVDYENRSGSYYALGTRFIGVLLSTARHRYDSDQVLREIEIKQPDTSENKGNVLLVRVKERVNERGFTKINTATGSDVAQPHGSREVEYEVDSYGHQTITDSSFDRLDEALFNWKSEQKPVRWLRNLDIHKTSNDESEITYRESFMIGRDENGLSEEQADLKIRAVKGTGALTSVVVEIGIGGDSSDKILFEDSTENVRVIAHSSAGMRTMQNQEEILKQHPNYAFLFESPIDKSRILELVESRVALLREDWDKAQPVFGQSAIESSQNTLET